MSPRKRISHSKKEWLQTKLSPCDVLLRTVLQPCSPPAAGGGAGGRLELDPVSPAKEVCFFEKRSRQAPIPEHWQS